MLSAQIYNIYQFIAFIAQFKGFFYFPYISTFFQLCAYFAARALYCAYIFAPMDLFKRATIQTIYLINYKSTN